MVAHSHGHHDHVGADGQFSDRPATTVVPVDVDSVRTFFGFDTTWPSQVVSLDLGGRLLEIIGSPGHHEAAITIYDPWTRILFTGDTVLPGRLFAFDSRPTWPRLIVWSPSPNSARSPTFSAATSR